MKFSEYVTAVRRNWVFVVATILLFSGVGILGAVITPSSYTATTQLVVSPVLKADAAPGDVSQANSAAQQRISSYLILATSSPVLQEAAEHLDLSLSAASLASQVSASTTTGTQNITISARATDPQQAADVANSVADAFIVEARTTDGATLSSLFKIKVLQPATPPTNADNAGKWSNAILASLAGFVVGIGLALVWSTLDRRIHSLRQLRDIAGLQVLLDIVLPASDQPADKDAFRRLRTYLQSAAAQPESTRSVVAPVDSLAAAQFVGFNLAQSFAESGGSVALLDGSNSPNSSSTPMPSSSKSTFSAGATDEKPDLFDVVHFGSGSVADPWGSGAGQELLRELGAKHHHVVVVSPPVLASAASAELARLVGDTILVVQLGVVKSGDVEASLESLSLAGAKLRGLAVVRVGSEHRRRFRMK